MRRHDRLLLSRFFSKELREWFHRDGGPQRCHSAAILAAAPMVDDVTSLARDPR